MYVLYGGLIALLFAFIPWFLFIPEAFVISVGGGQSMMALGMLLGFFFGVGYAWVRYGSCSLTADANEVWYYAHQQVVWGGKWSELVIRRKGLRVWVIDPQGRLQLLEHLTLFCSKREFVRHFRGIRRAEPPRELKRSTFFWGLGALIVSVALAAVVPGPFYARLRADAGLVIDAIFVILLLGIALAQLLMLAGLMVMVVSLPAVLSTKWRDTLMMGSKVVGSEPVVMEPGVRYAYLRPDVLKRRMPPAWKVHLVLSPIYLCCMAVGRMPAAKGESMWPIGLILFAITGVMGWLIGRDSQRWHDCADDEFEITRQDELIIYRGGHHDGFAACPNDPIGRQSPTGACGTRCLRMEIGSIDWIRAT